MGTRMDMIYNISLMIGFTVPIVNILFGFLSGLADIDFDMDGDTDLDSATPFNLLSLMFALIVFGAVGKMDLAGGFILPLFLAVLSYYIMVKWVVTPLKRNKAYPTAASEFIGSVGVVLTTIPGDKIGEIGLSTGKDAKVTYFAKSIDGVQISAGEEVKVISVEDTRTLVVDRV